MFCTFWHFYTPEKKRNLLCCLLLLMLSNRGCSSWFWNLSWTVCERNGLFLFWLKKANIFNESYLSPVRFNLFRADQVYGGSFALCTKRTTVFSLHMQAVTSDLTEIWCMKNCSVNVAFIFLPLASRTQVMKKPNEKQSITGALKISFQGHSELFIWNIDVF